MNYIKTFHEFPRIAKIMTIKTLLLSAWYRFRILTVPFERLAKKMGIKDHESSQLQEKDNYIVWVHRVVEAVSRHTPWESNCFVKALTAKRLLNRKGYKATIYMGVGKDNEGKLIAHAWLRCGLFYVTGGNGTLNYAVTGFWGDK